jgi:hypothetical protein
MFVHYKHLDYIITWSSFFDKAIVLFITRSLFAKKRGGKQHGRPQATPGAGKSVV